MINGPAYCLRALVGKTGQDLGFYYHSNGKEWMTKIIFFVWIQSLESYVCRIPVRNILLLFHYFSTYGAKDVSPHLQNFCVLFLPPNKTMKIQLMHTGNIAWVKGKYRRRLLFRIFEDLYLERK